VNAEGGVTRLARVMSIRAFLNMAVNHYKPGELFRRFHLQNVKKKTVLVKKILKKSTAPAMAQAFSPIIKLN